MYLAIVLYKKNDDIIMYNQINKQIAMIH